MRLITRSKLHDFSLLCAVLLSASATTWSLAAGAGVWAVGVAFQIWSKSALKRTNVLSNSGPYAVCRHPFYLANAIFDLGICVMSGSPWLVALYPLAFWAGYLPTIRKEEAELSALFPEAYAEFRRTTPMVLPSFPGLIRRPRAPLSWENLRVERQFSRTVRYGAFPLVVWLAARIWDNPYNLLNSGNLAILGACASLGALGLVLYGSYEQREDSRATHLAVRLAPYAAVATAVVFFAAVALRELEMEDFTLAATLAALLVGWAMAAPSALAILGARATVARAVLVVGLAALACYGVVLLETPYALPAAAGLVLVLALVPAAHPRMPKTRLAAGALLLVLGATTMVGFHRMWSDLRTLEPVRAALREEVREGDRVVILEDRELRVLVGQPGIDGEVTAPEIAAMAHHSTPGARVFILAEDDDLRLLPPALRRMMQVRREVRVWIETFYLLEVSPSGGSGSTNVARASGDSVARAVNAKGTIE